MRPNALFAAALAAGALSVAAPAASAIQCPPGTVLRSITVADRKINYCVPYVQCDPGSCDPIYWLD